MQTGESFDAFRKNAAFVGVMVAIALTALALLIGLASLVTRMG